MTPQAEQDFRNALSAAGIALPPGETARADDAIHRYRGPDDKDNRCWYILHEHPSAASGQTLVCGAYGRWGSLPSTPWSSRLRNTFSQEEQRDYAQSQQAMARKRAEDERRLHAEAAAKCQRWFATFPKAKSGDSMYLVLKGVPEPHGPLHLFTEEMYQGWLALPLQDADGIVSSAQFIADDGQKKFLWGGEVKGRYYALSEVPGGPILICEGYATGASLYEATGWTVVCAMNCGNLLPVAKSLRAKHPERSIVLCADDDRTKEVNKGREDANAASKAIRGLTASPQFSDNASAGVQQSDFNDLHQASGLDEVRRQVYDAFPVVGRPIGLLTAPPDEDPTELLRYRYLCERGGLLFNGPTGVGKSSISIQQAACWCNGLPFFGVYPSKRLKIVVIQAENDDGDVAQMRDGICTGLNLTQEQRQTFFERCIIHTATRGLVGRQFCTEIVRPLLDLHAPHMLHIDPALSFVGGDVKEQRIVGEFLRVYLNPELFDHQCGCELFHHTNKPLVGKEKANWANGEWAYSGSGSAEFANWARAVLALQSLGTPGFYTLHAGKRGGRLGWSTEEDSDVPTYKKPIAWSNQKGLIFWRTPDPSEIPADAGPGRPAAFTTADLLDLLSSSGTTLSTREWKILAKDELGMEKTSFYNLLASLEADQKIFQAKSNKRWSTIQPRNTQTND